MGASSFGCYDLDRIKALCQISKVNKDYHDWRQSHVINNRDQFARVVACLEIMDSRLWAKRIEGHFLDIYTNDKEFYDTMSLDLADLIAQRYEPDELYLDLLDNANAIVCDALPHGKYNYRVYLQPHKLAGDAVAKQKTLDWLISQSPKITCTTAIQLWFIKTDWNWDRRYVLVEDEATLLMLKLRCDHVVGTVYKYVVVDK